MKPTAIAINQLSTEQTGSQALAERMAGLLGEVRRRAYELFHGRGEQFGHDLDDWLQAENELGVLPLSQIDDVGQEIRIRIERADFTADQITVHAEKQAITVEAAAVRKSDNPEETNVTESSLFGRYELPAAIDPALVRATLRNGVLEIVAKKAAQPAKPQDTAQASPTGVDAKPPKERTAVA